MAEQNPGAPGWFRDEGGQHWWWDGTAWTQPPSPGVGSTGHAPISTVTDHSGETTKGWVLWLATLLGPGWIVALIFYFVDAERSFVRHHASEILNLTITAFAMSIIGTILMVPGYVEFISSGEDLDTSVFGPVFFIGLAINVSTSLFTWIVAIVGILRARRGTYWRAPLPLRVVKGTLPRGSEPPYRLD